MLDSYVAEHLTMYDNDPYDPRHLSALYDAATYWALKPEYQRPEDRPIAERRYRETIAHIREIERRMQESANT